VGLALAVVLVVAPPAAAVSPLPSDFQSGATLAEWSATGFGSSASDGTLGRLHADGGNSVAIVPTWSMSRSTSSSIAPASYSPTDASVLHAIATAKSQGMHVLLKPHVDVADGSWRGAIQPSDPAAWWLSYDAMMDHWADLAKQAGADILSVGTELKTMEGYGAQWQSLVADLRSRFSGQLTYAANWDSYAGVPFWGALDYIGIDAYFPLANSTNPNPTVSELVAAWSSWISEIGSVQQAANKPVLFTEIGYQDRVGTAVTPYNSSGAIAPGPQQRAYEALFEALANMPWLKGVYWWDFHATGYAANDGDWDPSGNPAEATMSDWYTGNPNPTPVPEPNRAPTATLTAPAAGSTFTTAISAAATATDDQGVASVDFLLDGVRKVTDTAPPYTARITVDKHTSYGRHTLSARARDAAGLVSPLSSVSITRVR
jgi:hypothetical protein